MHYYQYLSHNMSTKSSLICDRVSIYLISLAALFGMIAFIPGGFIPVGILKGYIILILTLLGLISWILGRFFEGCFRAPQSPLVLALGVLIVTQFFSALFSKSSQVAFFGENFEQGTFAVFGSLLVLTFLVSTLFTNTKKIFLFIKCYFVLYLVIALFQLIHLFFPQITSMGVFSSRVDSLVGAWGDFSIISGSALIGFALAFQFTKPSNKLKALYIFGMIISLFFVILCNIFTVWVIVGLFSIIVLIYTLVANRLSEEKKFPLIPFLLSFVSLLFILANNLIGDTLAALLKASFIDVHPSFLATAHVAAGIIKSHPILGSGPNNFINEWLINRPVLVNSNPFWNAPFTAGSSFLSTVAVLSGLFGILAVTFFIGSFLYTSVKSVFLSVVEKEKRIKIFSFFVITMYFLTAITVYSPGVSVVLISFFSIGLFIAFLSNEGFLKIRSLNFLKDQRISFFSILVIVAVLMLSASFIYVGTERFVSNIFFQEAISESRKGNLDGANNYLTQAIRLSDLPVYERTKVFIAEQSIQKTLNTSANDTSSDNVKSILQNAISLGNASAISAISLDSQNPTNYIVLGDFIKKVAVLKIEGAGDRAIEAYNKAISLAPNYPKSYLSLAQLYFDSGDNTNAGIYAQKAIDLKKNYTEAYYLMAQIEVVKGNTQGAVDRLQDATLFDPNNPDTFFELGLIRFQNEKFADAVSAFRSVLIINTQYLNAWYYLALADKKVGNLEEAKTILTALQKRFPDDKNITSELNSISDKNSNEEKTKNSRF
jgi:tetratricopeptide (TPR) repeat protein